MKALLQRVKDASVKVGEEVIGSIGNGLVVFIGVSRYDTEEDAYYLARKVTGLRIFSDRDDRFNFSAVEKEAELLIVSQFTLLADTRKGRRPSFVDAASPVEAERLFERFVEAVSTAGIRVATGRFGHHMMVEICNDGPVTVLIDSSDR